MNPPDTVLLRAGRLLFRWRSFTPVPLVLLAVPLLWRSRGAASPLWLVAGLLSCAAGQALRAWVLGQVPDGTSGQNEKLIAVSLNTTGPYAFTRNPLYLGNFGITVGLCLVAHDPLLAALVAALFGLQYRAIIAAEEDFLRGQFGAEFDAFCARVPRFWPRLAGARGPGGGADQSPIKPPRPFDWRRALRKEHNPAAAWIALAIVFVAADRARLSGFSLQALWPYGAALAATAFAWLCVKGWKHRWLHGGFTADLRRRLRETAR
jgi:protein-S-isoprenylcysteine O-methyltransferase Ste14